MHLKVQHFDKVYYINVNGSTIEDCLQIIFNEPLYFLSFEENGNFTALGADVLKASVITKASDASYSFL